MHAADFLSEQLCALKRLALCNKEREMGMGEGGQSFSMAIISIIKTVFLLILKFQSCIVTKEIFVWLVELSQQKDEWKFVSKRHGEQCVVTLGMIMMLGLFAENLDFCINVRNLQLY